MKSLAQSEFTKNDVYLVYWIACITLPRRLICIMIWLNIKKWLMDKLDLFHMLIFKLDQKKVLVDEVRWLLYG